MLYYIIPPIIIIVSLAILIYYLFRKVSKVPAGELDFLNENRRIFSLKRVGAIFPLIGSFFLRLLEKIIHKSKLFSLKFHNLSSNWSNSIRKKREKSKEPISNDENIRKNRKNNKQIEKRKGFSVLKFKRAGKVERYGMVDDEVVSKEIRTQAVSMDGPRPNKRKESRFEEDLIQRIAVNPKDIEAYERLGEYYIDCGSGEDALECYRQVLKLSPGQFKAKSRVRAIERTMEKDK